MALAPLRLALRLLALAAAPLPAAEAQTRVAGAAELAGLIAAAPAGAVLELAGGAYGTLELRGLSMPRGRPLVLRAADPAEPPVFSGLELDGVENLVLEGLVFDYAFAPGDPLWLMPFRIDRSRGVTIRDAVFDGDTARGASAADNGFPTGQGLLIGHSDGVTVEGSEVRGFFRGIGVGSSADVTLRGNDLHGLRMDGMTFAEVERVRIEGNHIHDFDRSLAAGDHADMIQFWTTDTARPTRDVVIRGNLLNSGDGWLTQSIFMRNEEVDQGRAGAELFYRDVAISENVIINAHLHGITVGETAGLSIERNTVVHNRDSQDRQVDDGVYVPQINVAARSRDVRIAGNVAGAIPEGDGGSGWSVADNLPVQRRTRTAPGFYDGVFAGGDPADPASYRPRPGGPLDGAGIGASWIGRGG